MVAGDRSAAHRGIADRSGWRTSPGAVAAALGLGSMPRPRASRLAQVQRVPDGASAFVR